MTLTERVLRHLEESRERWVLADGGTTIRTAGNRLCPLESARGWNKGEVNRRLLQWRQRRWWFGNLGKRARAIIEAADLAIGHDPALRARMLAAAGLEEQQ